MKRNMKIAALALALAAALLMYVRTASSFRPRYTVNATRKVQISTLFLFRRTT